MPEVDAQLPAGFKFQPTGSPGPALAPPRPSLAVTAGMVLASTQLTTALEAQAATLAAAACAGGNSAMLHHADAQSPPPSPSAALQRPCRPLLSRARRKLNGASHRSGLLQYLQISIHYLQCIGEQYSATQSEETGHLFPHR